MYTLELTELELNQIIATHYAIKGNNPLFNETQVTIETMRQYARVKTMGFVINYGWLRETSGRTYLLWYNCIMHSYHLTEV